MKKRGSKRDGGEPSLVRRKLLSAPADISDRTVWLMLLVVIVVSLIGLLVYLHSINVLTVIREVQSPGSGGAAYGVVSIEILPAKELPEDVGESNLG